MHNIKERIYKNLVEKCCCLWGGELYDSTTAVRGILFFKNLFLAALGLRCCMQAFSSCSECGLLFVAVCGLLIAVASLVAENGLWHAVFSR